MQVVAITLASTSPCCFVDVHALKLSVHGCTAYIYCMRVQLSYLVALPWQSTLEQEEQGVCEGLKIISPTSSAT